MPKSTKTQSTLTPQLMRLTITNLSVEELIGHAHRGTTQPEADITLSNGETLGQKDKIDFYAAISKEIASAIHQLRQHQVQIIGYPRDASHIVLAKTTKELQRRAQSLLSNNRVSDKLKAQFREIETPDTQEAHSIQQLIQMYAILNTMDEVLFEAARRKDLDALHLNFQYYGITYFSEKMVEVLKSYPNLVTLNLSNNQLSTLHDSIGQLKNLESLVLNMNQLITLPDSIGQLTQLQKLRLDENQLTTLPDTIGQLRKLQWLCLSENKLITLPDAIQLLNQLQRLDLNFNPLMTLPDAIRHLVQLQFLNLTCTQLITLPEFIGELRQLQKLRLIKNQFTTLPDTMRKLTQLQDLSIGKNKLSFLPNSMRAVLEQTGNIEEYGHLLSKPTGSIYASSAPNCLLNSRSSSSHASSSSDPRTPLSTSVLSTTLTTQHALASRFTALSLQASSALISSSTSSDSISSAHARRRPQPSDNPDTFTPAFSENPSNNTLSHPNVPNALIPPRRKRPSD